MASCVVSLPDFEVKENFLELPECTKDEDTAWNASQKVRTIEETFDPELTRAVPLSVGRRNGQHILVLRDTGCNAVIVRERLV